jgi:hypothetical protein
MPEFEIIFKKNVYYETVVEGEDLEDALWNADSKFPSELKLPEGFRQNRWEVVE